MFTGQRFQQASLDPAACHTTQMAKDTEYRSSSAQLCLFIPRTQNKVRTYTVQDS